MMFWPIVLFGVALIGCGVAFGYLWWGVAYNELSEVHRRDRALLTLRSWEKPQVVDLRDNVSSLFWADR